MVGERQRSQGRPSAAPKNKSSFLVLGTVGALVAAGIGVQVLRAKPSTAGEERGTATASQSDASRPVARVNGKLISYEEVARECMDRFGKEVLENVINRTVIQQACAEKGIQVTGAEVDNEILKISKRFGLDKSSWYKMLEVERGLNPIQYRRDVIWPMLALKKLAGTEIAITDRELAEAFEDAYGRKARVKMIMLDKMRHAQKIWERVSKVPDDFERIARDQSIEPNSRSIGGTIPPIRRFTGAHPEVRKAAFQLREPGEISGIIQVDVERYVILKFDGFTEPVQHSKESVRGQLHEELVEAKVQKLVARTFEQLKDATPIDNYITGESTRRTRQVSSSGSAPVRNASQQRTAPSQREPGTARTGTARTGSYPQTSSRRPQTQQPQRRSR